MAKERVLGKVCHYYYREGMNQTEIGDRLGMSRHTVGRLIKEAHQKGIVRIDIVSAHSKTSQLEHDVESELGLKASVIVYVDEGLSDQVIVQRVCRAGAEFLSGMIKDEDTIGISWGRTMHGLVNQVDPQKRDNLTVVQITGGNRWLPPQFDCPEVTRRLATKLGGKPEFLHAPGIVDKKETRDYFLAESSIAETVRLFDRIDIAVVGIGSLAFTKSSSLNPRAYIPRTELDLLLRAGAVGDVFSYFIDAQGHVVETPIHERLISLTIEQVRAVDSLLGVAVGSIKAKAVLGAIRGGFVNILVADSQLAEALLSEQRMGEDSDGSQG